MAFFDVCMYFNLNSKLLPGKKTQKVNKQKIRCKNSGFVLVVPMSWTRYTYIWYKYPAKIGSKFFYLLYSTYMISGFLWKYVNQNKWHWNANTACSYKLHTKKHKNLYKISGFKTKKWKSRFNFCSYCSCISTFLMIDLTDEPANGFVMYCHQ